MSTSTYLIKCNVNNKLGEDVYFGYCMADNDDNFLKDIDLKKVENNAGLPIFTQNINHRVTFSFCVVDGRSFLWSVSSMMVKLEKSDGTITIELLPGTPGAETVGYIVPTPAGTIPAVSILKQNGKPALAENTSFIAKVKSYAP
ncbi:hypothetical protein [Gilvimarinus sp. 1_MG-2023]|uniref:hypothetical protein n=1 Tax=Gilvimarinus sp. 1_MG-2023 TaxID=3062638 RepID=UPI0026E41F0C|nr:hypothetical protein [Gilvimarinus sp. 1_MG-2023]MDO6747698.1 hypothetical protein [Gilvimarinus sp. 1_MG-2023]